MVPEPYLGVTGVCRREDCLALLERTPDVGRKIMLGVLMSGKTIRGVRNNWPQRYPEAREVADIFVAHPRALNLVHFNTKEPEKLVEDLAKVMELGGANCHGVQLNMAWPSPNLVEMFRDMFPLATVVLQVGSRAFADTGPSPIVLAERVADWYGGSIDYVLLDPSGGEGKALSSEDLLPFVKKLYARAVPAAIGVGVAGGLSAETMDLMDRLWDRYPDLSIDAEGKLRDEPEDKEHGDRFNLGKASAYLTTAARRVVAV